jgi:hypothetical protein
MHGRGGFNMELLEYALKEVKQRLLYIINHCTKLNNIPKGWNEAVITSVTPAPLFLLLLLNSIHSDVSHDFTQGSHKS